MFDAVIRKTRQFAGDPVLRKWLLRRVAGAAAGPAAWTAHRPPYLNGVSYPDDLEPAPPETFPALSATPPTGTVTLPLPGLRLPLAPEDVAGVFTRPYADIETLLALHRFAWLPLVRDADAGAWGQALWDEWRRHFSRPDDGWAWHPYTTAERAVNILDLARRHGLPAPAGETARLLARHAEAIFSKLEYFGDHNTSNHLANNGRGLFRLGLALGIEAAAAAGARILEEEAARILGPSGVLREGSSHYHLLVARNYADSWLAARAHGRAEEPALGAVAARALAAVSALMLPGGLPLVGDISPDCPPDYVIGLAGAGTGWMAGLAEGDRDALRALIAATPRAASEDLAADGWLRFDRGPWAGLWHLAPGGWPPMPGHGHQDAGGFEVHYRDQPLFVDPGRGAYGDTGEAALFRSGRVHNTLLVDGHDPFPANKPYYDDAFRTGVSGPPPTLAAEDTGVVLGHGGFRRLGGVGTLRRRWRFADRGMTLIDDLEGRGRHRVSRLLATPLAAEIDGGGVVLAGGGASFRVDAPGAAAAVSPLTLWRAYGEGRPGTLIAFETEAALPWSGELRLEVTGP